jgi:hypothetical protein
MNKQAGVAQLVEQHRPILRARVITPDAFIHQLDPNTIEEASAGGSNPEVYSDRKRLRAPLPSIVEGAVWSR